MRNREFKLMRMPKGVGAPLLVGTWTVPPVATRDWLNARHPHEPVLYYIDGDE